MNIIKRFWHWFNYGIAPRTEDEIHEHARLATERVFKEPLRVLVDRRVADLGRREQDARNEYYRSARSASSTEAIPVRRNAVPIGEPSSFEYASTADSHDSSPSAP